MNITQETPTISQTATECIDCLIELILEEHYLENKERGFYDLYEQYCTQLQEQLTNEMEVALWEIYQNLLYEEAAYFNPHQAYSSGREAKLDGELDKQIAYDLYIEKLKDDPAYRFIKEQQITTFDGLISSLDSTSLRDKLCKIDQLYKRLYSPIEKNLWIFFHLGYDCCPA